MLDPARAQRYRRHDLIDWFSQEQVAATRIAVIGAGAVGNEVVKNLALLGCGTIDVYDFDTVELHNLTRSILLREADTGRNKAEAVAERARDIDPNVTVRAVPGDFWDTLSLGRLRDYDCAIAAVDNFEARLKLNQLCLLARVDLVNAGLDSRWAVVESFPFGGADGRRATSARCPRARTRVSRERYSCGGLTPACRTRAPDPDHGGHGQHRRGARGLDGAAARRAGGAGAPRRRLFDTINGCGSVGRRSSGATGCPGCGEFDAPPRVVRTPQSLGVAPRVQAAARVAGRVAAARATRSSPATSAPRCGPLARGRAVRQPPCRGVRRLDRTLPDAAPRPRCASRSATRFTRRRAGGALRRRERHRPSSRWPSSTAARCVSTSRSSRRP